MKLKHRLLTLLIVLVPMGVAVSSQPSANRGDRKAGSGASRDGAKVITLSVEPAGQPRPAGKKKSGSKKKRKRKK